MLKIIIVVRFSGFAVVFAEDIPDTPSTDIPSGKSICFCQSMGRYANLTFKMLGLPCALYMMTISTRLSEHKASEETISMIVYS